MDRDPGDFDKRDTDVMRDLEDDSRLEMLLASMPSDWRTRTSDEDTAAITLARVQIAKGEGIPHVIVGAWLRTWGKPGRLPFWEWYRTHHG